MSTEAGEVHYYNFHRYYNPDTGRYLTPDPIGLEGGTNLYGYVGGNPAGAGDPLGLDWESADGSVPGWANQLIVGYRVHEMFTQYVKGLGNYGANDSYGGVFGNLRPDAYDYINKKVWELKPLSNRDDPYKYETIATTQINKYIKMANRPTTSSDPKTKNCGDWSKGATDALFSQGQTLGYIQIGLGPFRRIYEITLWHDTPAHGANTGLVFYRADLIDNPTGEFFDKLLKVLAKGPKYLPLPFPGLWGIPIIP